MTSIQTLRTMFIMSTPIPSTKRQYDLEERTEAFADCVRTFVAKIPSTLSNDEDKKQLIRSSGSVASNYIEANESLGKGDFIMRIRICLKEAKESRLWLTLLRIPVHAVALEQERQHLRDEAQSFVRIFSTILRKVLEKWNYKNKHS